MERDKDLFSCSSSEHDGSFDERAHPRDADGKFTVKGETTANEKSNLFAQQVDDVISGRHAPIYDLYVSKTPKVLLDLGFDNTPMLMRNSKIREILDKHSEMSVELIKQIPDGIESPLLILKSRTHPTESVVMITDINTAKGEMIVPVWVNQDGAYLDVEVGGAVRMRANFVASAYGRNVKTLIEEAFEQDQILYCSKDKEKVSDLLATHGLQLPARLSNR